MVGPCSRRLPKPEPAIVPRLRRGAPGHLDAGRIARQTTRLRRLERRRFRQATIGARFKADRGGGVEVGETRASDRRPPPLPRATIRGALRGVRELSACRSRRARSRTPSPRRRPDRILLPIFFSWNARERPPIRAIALGLPHARSAGRRRRSATFSLRLSQEPGGRGASRYSRCASIGGRLTLSFVRGDVAKVRRESRGRRSPPAVENLRRPDWTTTDDGSPSKGNTGRFRASPHRASQGSISKSADTSASRKRRRVRGSGRCAAEDEREHVDDHRPARAESLP